jgi:aminopeptidase-like protein
MADGTENPPRARQMFELIRELYPICRSITGDGARRTLEIIGRYIPLQVTEVPSGTEVLDWTVPREWNIKGGYIQTLSGQRVIDFAEHNLHVLNYSVPVDRRISREELDGHLWSIPEHPDWIPYRTSYYAERWGFCVSQRQREALTDPEYVVKIDTTLEPGHLTYAECVIPGESQEEILLTTHICHPSLCNDNLSGIAVATFLLREARSGPRPRYTLRVLFIPGTIGSIAWLAKNRERVGRVKHGMSLVCLGDDNPLTYKRSLQGDAEVDRILEHALGASSPPRIIDYFPYGYDERQFNSPGFAVPFGSLMRGQHGQFPEYHTSADNLSFVKEQNLEGSLALVQRVVGMLNDNRTFINQRPYGEPQLGKRGVYRALGGTDIADTQLAIFWVLALSDGKHSLLDIARRAKLSFELIRDAAGILERTELLACAPSA